MGNFATTKIQDGVYEIEELGLTIRIIVLSRIPKVEHNAIWNIFSNVEEKIEFGAKQFEEARKEMTSVRKRLNLRLFHLIIP